MSTVRKLIQFFRIDLRLFFGLSFTKDLLVSRGCRLLNPLPKAQERVVKEPLRPRRNPNRIGYQAVAAGEKRTAGDFEEPKSASKKSKAP